MTLLSLFRVFFQVGLFTIGGGLVAIPIIQEKVIPLGWVSQEMFYNMIAISESTPGPIGVNMATFVGYERAGIPGAVIATLGCIMPCFIITILIARFFARYNEKPVVRYAMYGVRAAVCGLIATAAYSVLNITVITKDRFFETNRIFDIVDFPALLIFIGIFVLYRVFKKHPLWYILLGAICGAIFL